MSKNNSIDSSKPWHSDPPRVPHERMPTILNRLFGENNKLISSERLPDGTRRMQIPMHNGSAQYDLSVLETPDFITMHTEVARFKAPAAALYGELHDINAETYEGKLIVERDVTLNSTFRGEPEQIDSVLFEKQIRKWRVPETTIVQEMTSFDIGVERVYTEIQSIARESGVEMLPGTTRRETGIISATQTATERQTGSVSILDILQSQASFKDRSS